MNNYVSSSIYWTKNQNLILSPVYRGSDNLYNMVMLRLLNFIRWNFTKVKTLCSQNWHVEISVTESVLVELYSKLKLNSAPLIKLQ